MTQRDPCPRLGRLAPVTNSVRIGFPRFRSRLRQASLSLYATSAYRAGCFAEIKPYLLVRRKTPLPTLSPLSKTVFQGTLENGGRSRGQRKNWDTNVNIRTGRPVQDLHTIAQDKCEWLASSIHLPNSRYQSRNE